MTVDVQAHDFLVDALGDADLFRDLPDVRAALAGHMTTVAVANGELIEQGAPAIRCASSRRRARCPCHQPSRGGAAHAASRTATAVAKANLLLDTASPITARGIASLAALSAGFIALRRRESRRHVRRHGGLRPPGVTGFGGAASKPHFWRSRPAALDDLESALEFMPLCGGEI
jgi:hypothetical protein